MRAENRPGQRGGEGNGLLSQDPDGLYLQEEWFLVQNSLLAMKPDEARDLLRKLTREQGLSHYYVNPQRALRYKPLRPFLMDHFLP